MVRDACAYPQQQKREIQVLAENGKEKNSLTLKSRKLSYEIKRMSMRDYFKREKKKNHHVCSSNESCKSKNKAQ